MSLLFSNTFGDAFLAHFFGGGSLSNITFRQYSLWGGNPLDSGTEVSGTSYVRQSYVDITTCDFAASSGGNGYAQDSGFNLGFPDNASTPSAGNWTQATHLGMSIVSGAAPVLALVMPAPVTVVTGDSLQFPIGALKVELGTPDSPWLIDSTFAQLLLDFLVGDNGTAPSAPVTWYMSLWTGNPFAGGSEVSTSSTGYGRRGVTNSGAWTSPAANADGARSVTNVAALRFPASGSATGSWGTVLYVAFSTGASSAPVFARKLSTGRVVTTGGFLNIPIGGLEIALNSAAP